VLQPCVAIAKSWRGKDVDKAVGAIKSIKGRHFIVAAFLYGKEGKT